MANRSSYDPAGRSGYGFPNTVQLTAQTLSATKVGKDSWYTNQNWAKATTSVAHLEDVQWNQDVITSHSTPETVTLNRVDANGVVLEALATYTSVTSLAAAAVQVSLRGKKLYRGEGLSLDVLAGSGGTQGSGVRCRVNMTCFGIER
jgi:cellulase/cellobiase CelA1